MKKGLGTLAMMTILAHGLAAQAFENDDAPIQTNHRIKPKSYGIHLSKAERKGKTWNEIQRMREDRL
jgi:hypothetical protein